MFTVNSIIIKVSVFFSALYRSANSLPIMTIRLRKSKEQRVIISLLTSS